MSNERRLRRSEKRMARQWAADTWVEAKGDTAQAEVLLKERSEKSGIDPATILLIARIVMLLWDFWKSRKVSMPSAVIDAEEWGVIQGDDDDDEEDDDE